MHSHLGDVLAKSRPPRTRRRRMGKVPQRMEASFCLPTLRPDKIAEVEKKVSQSIQASRGAEVRLPKTVQTLTTAMPEVRIPAFAKVNLRLEFSANAPTVITNCALFFRRSLCKTNCASNLPANPEFDSMSVATIRFRMNPSKKISSTAQWMRSARNSRSKRRRRDRASQKHSRRRRSWRRFQQCRRCAHRLPSLMRKKAPTPSA